MPEPYIAQEAASYVLTQTGAFVLAVVALAILAACFSWAARKVRGVL